MKHCVVSLSFLLMIFAASAASASSATADDLVILAKGDVQERAIAERPRTVVNSGILQLRLQNKGLRIVGLKRGTAKIIFAHRAMLTVVVVDDRNREALHALSSFAQENSELSLTGTPYHLGLRGFITSLDEWMRWKALQRQFPDLIDHTQVTAALQPSIQSFLSKALYDRSLAGAELTNESPDNPEPVLRLGDDSPKEQAKVKKFARDYNIAVKEDSDNVVLKPLVEVNITIAEMKREEARSLGIKLPGSFTASVVPSPDLSSAAWNWNPIEGSIEAHEQRVIGRVIASPRLMCRSGDKAHFVAGGEIPIKVTNWTQTGVSWKTYGVILDIMPKADLQGRISTGLVTEISLIDSAHTVDGIPGLLTNRIETHVDLRSAQTIALSGLVKNETAKSQEGLPFFSSIPILGELFKSKDFQNNKTELIIFITPRVVTADNPTAVPTTPPPPWMQDADDEGSSL